MTETYQCKLGSIAVKNVKGGLLEIDVADRSINRKYTIDDGTPKTLAYLKMRLQCFDPARSSMKVAASRDARVESNPVVPHRSSDPSHDVFSEMIDQREKLMQLISSNTGKKRR